MHKNINHFMLKRESNISYFDEEYRKSKIDGFFLERNIDPIWNTKLCSLAHEFSKTYQNSSMMLDNFSALFDIKLVSDGLISDSFFLNSHEIDSGIANCTVSKIVTDPSVIIVKTAFPDPDLLENDMLNEIMNLVLQLNVQIILSIDPFPPKLLGKCILNQITVIHNIKQETLDFFTKFTQIPVLDSLISLYSSIDMKFSGLFYVASGGFDPSDEADKNISNELYKLIKGGSLIQEGQNCAFFISSIPITYGSFILTGCQNIKVQHALQDLIMIDYDDYCMKIINPYFGFEPNIENLFKTMFPYSLVHFTTPGYSVCTTKLANLYSETDITLKRFFKKSVKHAETENPIFTDNKIDNSLFNMEKFIQFRILHENYSLTFSAFNNIVIEDETKSYILINNEIKPIDNEQFFEISFSSFARYLFYAENVPEFILVHGRNAMHVCRSPNKVVFNIAPPQTAPLFVQNRGRYLNSSSNPDELRHAGFYSNLIHATEVIYAQSLSKCPPESSGPLFAYLNTFLKAFTQKVINNKDLACTLNTVFFTTFFNWFMKVEHIATNLKNIKLPEQILPYATTVCRTIILRLLWFIEFPHISEVLNSLKDFDEQINLGVKAEWLFDRNDGKKPKNPSTSEYLQSFVVLLWAAENTYFFPDIIMLHSTNVNLTKPNSILAYILACDKFHMHLLYNCPSELSEYLFNREMTPEIFAEYLSVNNVLSPKFVLELEEKFPLPWNSSKPQKLHIEIRYPTEFTAIMSMCGYSFDMFIEILSHGKQSVTFGGKSSAQFFITLDNRFLIKTINQAEMSEMNNFLPHYFKYIASNPDTLLTRVLSVFSIVVDGSVTYKCILMENLRFGFSSDDLILYDFKGAMRNRFLGENNQSVMLDANYEKSALDNRIILTLQKKKSILKQLLQDANFLASHNIMDYSLLVVLSKSSMLVRMGIVDYFRKYTIDKALETWVKKTPIYEQYKIDPTIISPDNYYDRFVSAMDKYLYQSPYMSDVGELTESSLEEEEF